MTRHYSRIKRCQKCREIKPLRGFLRKSQESKSLDAWENTCLKCQEKANENR